MPTPRRPLQPLPTTNEDREPDGSTLRDRLAQRMKKPQRHRLLQGFPAVPAMSHAVPPTDDLQAGATPQIRTALRREGRVRRLDGALVDTAFALARDRLAQGRPAPLPLDPDTPQRRALRAQVEQRQDEAEAHWKRTVARGDRSTPPLFSVDATRDLIVGIIPHTQCVPAKEGCGFCTFPHDAANPRARRDMLESVLSEIEHHGQSDLLRGRRVHALYIGGGTANLSDPAEIAMLVHAVGKGFQLDEAELSLEGTPHLFERLLSSHLKNLAAQKTQTQRISIGVQTFDEGFLRQMGRQAFGSVSTVKKLVKKARSLSIATSADLLFNLPGQTAAQMDHDLDQALSCDLDQICLYNLVLYEGLGTPWSKQPALVQAMRSSDEACGSWLHLRERLLQEGYVQTTLTNFERADVAAGPARFRYELASFSPERTDGLGIGPLGLSTFVNPREGRGLKLLRRKSLAGTPWSREDLLFEYDAQTLPLLFFTRSLAKTRIDGALWPSSFGVRLTDAFAEPLAACVEAGLVEPHPHDIVLSPAGMFYADAVVATFIDGFRSDGAGIHTADLLRERPQASEYISMG